MTDALFTLFLMLSGHALVDFGLQTEWLATHKNRHSRDRYSPEERKRMEIIWPHLLAAHALMHGGAVYVVTQNPTLSVLEFLAHATIDFAKGERWFSFHTDQFLHIFTKVIWVLLLMQGWV